METLSPMMSTRAAAGGPGRHIRRAGVKAAGVGGGGGVGDAFVHAFQPGFGTRVRTSSAKSFAIGVLPCQLGSSAKDPQPGSASHTAAAASAHTAMLVAGAPAAKLQPPRKSSLGSASVSLHLPFTPGQLPEWHV